MSDRPGASGQIRAQAGVALSRSLGNGLFELRALAYELVARNQLPAVRLGRRLLVPRHAIETLLRQTGRAA